MILPSGKVFCSSFIPICIYRTFCPTRNGGCYAEKQDPRTMQTKALIKSTLLELMQKTAFDKITVTELCKQAGINRGTFYLHYYDLFTVLEELEDEALQEEPTQKPYHCSLKAEHYQCPYGICDKIHTHPEYGVIFFDDSLTSHVIEKIAAQSKEKYIKSLTEQCSLISSADSSKAA